MAVDFAPAARHLLVRAAADPTSGRPYGGAGTPARLHGAPAVVSATPFVEVLPSWNLVVPAGVAAAVELRVRAVDGTWSPWLFVGEWGAPLPSGYSPTTRFDGGAVAVDLVRAEVPLDGVQWRVLAFGAGGDDADLVRQFALCLSRAEDAVPFDPRPPVGRLPAALDVPFASQRAQDEAVAGRICSPTSVAMVLAFHGVETDVLAVARSAFDARYDLYGNWPRNVQAAFALGCPGRVERFEHWDAVADRFRRGVPLVASIGVRPGQLTGAPYESTAGHLIVLRGFDASGDVLVNDPAAPDARTGRTTYARDELDEVWLRRGGTAYVLSPPEPEAQERRGR